jgi:hypothetical protein
MSLRNRNLFLEVRVKNLLVVLFVITLGVMVEAQQQPSWLPEMVPDGVMWGIGNAKQSNQNFSKTMAEARARLSIAQQVYQFAQQTGYKKVPQNDVISIQLENSRVIRQWQAPDGTWWCLVEYSEAEAEKALGQFNIGG